MASKISLPSEAELKNLSEDERLMQAAQVAKAASSAQGMFESLKTKASLLTDPKERERVLSEAYDHEIEAKGLSRKARILKSGTFQGAAGGAGIGAATGAGLGTLVGTLTGTVLAIPTTLVGGIVGAGTGAIHGPWIKLGGGKGQDGEEKTMQVPQEAIDSGAVQVNEETGEVTVKDVESLEKLAAAAEQAAVVSAEQKGVTGDAGEKRRPKKLEIRSKQQEAAGKMEPPTKPEAKARRKPAKLEVRSKKVG